MNIGHSNKTQHIFFYEKRKMRIAVYNLQCILTVVYPIRNGHYKMADCTSSKGRCDDFDYYRSL